MPLQLLKYQPGVVKDISEYAAGKNGPFWIDSDLVRFKNGYPEKLGGWLKNQINALTTAGGITSTATSIEGIARRMVFWRADVDGEDRLAVGTHNHLLIIQNGAVYDITPLRDETNAATTISEALDTSETGIDLVSVAGFSASGTVKIDNEIIAYTSISSLTLTNCTRAANGTTAATHSSGAVITQVITGSLATTITADINASVNAIPLASVDGFAAAGTIKIGTEIITYTGINVLELTGCNRGVSSTAASHDSGAAVLKIAVGPIGTISGSKIVTIIDVAHGAKVTDWVVLSGAAAIGGITTDVLNSMAGHQITKVVDVNTYEITVPDAATSTVVAGGGLTVVIKYLIGIDAGMGAQGAVPALGWGVGGWGSDDMTLPLGKRGWGTARSTNEEGVFLDNTSWNLSLWGEDLIASVRGSAIYYYDTSAPITNRASLVSAISGAESVPTVARITTVSFPDRHFIVGGAQAYVAGGGGDVDNMLIRWSSQEQFEKFAPTATNTAGDQRLQIGTKIVAMVSSREETLICTDSALYSMNFVGGDFVFSFRLLATDCGAAGINTMINVDSTVFFMGKRNFFRYDGVVKEIPCPVQYFVFDRMNKTFIDKTVVGHNKAFKEVTWFYVSNNSPNQEPDSYVTLNYAENAWTVGNMDRTVWLDSFGARLVPFAFDPDGFLYNHETGTSDNGAAMNSFIEGSPREISAEGETLYMVDQVVPDVSMSANTSLDLYMNTRKYPNATEVVKGPFPITSNTVKISTRAKGRQIAIKFQSTGTTDQWTLGDFRINSRQDGLR